MSAQFRVLLIILCIGMAPLAGCAAGPGTGENKSINVNEQAALEATAIIQRAEATAIVLQAQAKATALIQNAGAPSATPTMAKPTAVPPVVEVTRAPAPPGVASPVTSSTATSGNASRSQVELLGVSFAADGNYIYVPFKAPPSVARQWHQGNVAVIDEATGITYDGIPVQPLIGPLIAHPIHEGQIGYVMFVNTDGGIHTGSIVTVVLGNFKQEHVPVKKDG